MAEGEGRSHERRHAPAPVGNPATYGDELDAVVGLALSTLPNEDDVRDALGGDALGLRPPSLGESLAQLAELTTNQERLGHRTIALRLLAKLASRRGMEPLRREAGTLREFLRATTSCTAQECARLHDHGRTVAPETIVPRPFVGTTVTAPIRDEAPEVQRMLDGLEAAAQRRAPSWQSFAPSAAGPLQLTDEELGLPRCSDQEQVPVGGHASTRVVTWFSSPKQASAFTRWTDPRTWPVDCSLFFRAITTDEPIDPGAESWSATFWEEVCVSSAKTMKTPLTFTRTVVGEDLYALYFTMPPGVATDDLLVDAGSLIARQDTCNPAARRTQLFAEKCLRFVDPALRTWPTLLCDLYWMELTMLAALGCRHD